MKLLRAKKAALKCRFRHFSAALGTSVPSLLRRTPLAIIAWGTRSEAENPLEESEPPRPRKDRKARPLMPGNRENYPMSASRLAIVAGLLTLALPPGNALAARKGRPIEPPQAPLKLEIAQIGADFFIGRPRTMKPAEVTVDVGSTVKIDQRLLLGESHTNAGAGQ
ncbi:hypothetical protein [Sphingobium yanoikuyae]|nr:hypothetical protein [Sphingobium yanoikuyae]MDV3482595.1 hypothetical protein [Sphingobium yanoikuyae]